ncbi:MAG: bifunctional heptose 7-phosphate kinase/heptose 1-phosphate adenyltransferase [Nanopusillaceae archaeon]
MINLDDLKSKLSKLRIAVIGDVMIDKYTLGKVQKISPEAPVPIFRITEESYTLGGAANVAMNLKALGVDVYLVGVVGNDIYASKLRELCKSNNINSFFVTKDNIPTIVKERIVSNNQHIVRIDREEDFILNDSEESKIFQYIKDIGITNVIVSDYDKGCITYNTIPKLKSIDNDMFIAVDPKSYDYTKYKGCNVIFPNIEELGRLMNLDPLDDKLNFLDSKKNKYNVIEVGKNLLSKVNSDAIVIKQSELGLSYVDSRDPKSFLYYPGITKNVVDVTGAGDTVISSFTALYLINEDIKDIIKFVSIAASKTISKLKVYAPKLKEIVEEFESESINTMCGWNS